MPHLFSFFGFDCHCGGRVEGVAKAADEEGVAKAGGKEGVG